MRPNWGGGVIQTPSSYYTYSVACSPSSSQ